MEFFIKKNATLPVLKLQIIKDGRSDFENIKNSFLTNPVFFSMTEIPTNILKIVRSQVEILTYIPEGSSETEYYINYQFSETMTSVVGRYKAEFTIETSDGILVLPLQEDVFINIQDSFAPVDSCCPDADVQNGTTYGLGRGESKDDRDWNYLISDHLPNIMTLTKITQKYWDDNIWWGDQGNTPQCVGYAWAHWIEDGPILHNGLHPVVNPTTIYKEAQKIDEWPGENYNGTSVRAGAKYLKNINKIKSYLWAFDLTTMINTVLNVGPVVVGTNWYYNMFFPDRNGVIKISGGLMGGHAYEINGVDTTKQLFRIKNSWGRRWGIQGRAYISFTDMGRLIKENGEVCLAVENKF